MARNTATDAGDGGPGGVRRFRHSLITGGFRPLHRGHAYLIDTALAACGELTILVGSRADEPIPGHLRYEWVRATYPQPQVHVVHSREDSLPAWTDPDYWPRWVRLAGAWLPGVDAVFSSEPYGAALAALLGATSVAVDPARITYPISGTAIRAQPLQHWAYLAPAARPYFARRVRVIGAESTGKTTLCRELAAHYHSAWAPEWARTYMAGNGNRFALPDVDAIVVGQLRVEEAAARACNRVLFCDTDPLLTRIYADHYLGTCPLYLQRLANERPYDLTLLLEPDLPWTDDGTRDPPADRAAIARLFVEALESRRVPYRRITGTGPARFAQARAAVDAALAGWGVDPALLTAPDAPTITWPEPPVLPRPRTDRYQGRP